MLIVVNVNALLMCPLGGQSERKILGMIVLYLIMLDIRKKNVNINSGSFK